MKEYPSFDCTLCGECCSGSMKVFINLYDLYKMARYLKMDNTKELFDKKLVKFDLGQNGFHLPRLQFKRQPFRFCPFLSNDFDEDKGYRGLCQLHLVHKPLVCRLAPFTREIDCEKGSDDFDFVLPHPDCPGINKGSPLSEEETRTALVKELDLEKEYYYYLSQQESIPESFYYRDVTQDYSLL